MAGVAFQGQVGRCKAGSGLVGQARQGMLGRGKFGRGGEWN